MKLRIAFFSVVLLAATSALAADPPVGRDSAPPEGVAPNSGRHASGFQELYQLLQKNLTGVSETELEQAAVQGLINQLHPLVSVVTNGGPDDIGRHASVLTNIGPHASVLEGAYAYFRFHQIADGTDKEFSTALKRIASTNRLKGLVLDLRFADGGPHASGGYPAAAALADLFLPTRQPMIDWGDGLKHSTPKTNSVNFPLAILVNSQTRGAAEAFAAILRRSEVGLLLGDNSAGQVNISREFTLKNGEKLRVATTPVKIAGQPIDRKGLSPDIKVQVPLAEERRFLQDPYRAIGPHASGLAGGASGSATLNGTNQTTVVGTNIGSRTSGRRRLNEAELVRMQREGIDFESEFVPGRDAGPLRPPVITDPVLARAVDLLKGLSVVHRGRTF